MNNQFNRITYTSFYADLMIPFVMRILLLYAVHHNNDNETSLRIYG